MMTTPALTMQPLWMQASGNQIRAKATRPLEAVAAGTIYGTRTARLYDWALPYLGKFFARWIIIIGSPLEEWSYLKKGADVCFEAAQAFPFHDYDSFDKAFAAFQEQIADVKIKESIAFSDAHDDKNFILMNGQWLMFNAVRDTAFFMGYYDGMLDEYVRHLVRRGTQHKRMNRFTRYRAWLAAMGHHIRFNYRSFHQERTVSRGISDTRIRQLRYFLRHSEDVSTWHENVLGILVYGSTAEGTATDESDLNWMLIRKDGDTFLMLDQEDMSFLELLEGAVSYPINMPMPLILNSAWDLQNPMSSFDMVLTMFFIAPHEMGRGVQVFNTTQVGGASVQSWNVIAKSDESERELTHLIQTRIQFLTKANDQNSLMEHRLPLKTILFTSTGMAALLTAWILKQAFLGHFSAHQMWTVGWMLAAFGLLVLSQRLILWLTHVQDVYGINPSSWLFINSLGNPLPDHFKDHLSGPLLKQYLAVLGAMGLLGVIFSQTTFSARNLITVLVFWFIANLPKIQWPERFLGAFNKTGYRVVLGTGILSVLVEWWTGGFSWGARAFIEIIVSHLRDIISVLPFLLSGLTYAIASSKVLKQAA